MVTLGGERRKAWRPEGRLYVLEAILSNGSDRDSYSASGSAGDCHDERVIQTIVVC